MEKHDKFSLFVFLHFFFRLMCAKPRTQEFRIHSDDPFHYSKINQVPSGYIDKKWGPERVTFLTITTIFRKQGFLLDSVNSFKLKFYLLLKILSNFSFFLGFTFCPKEEASWFQTHNKKRIVFFETTKLHLTQTLPRAHYNSFLI